MEPVSPVFRTPLTDMGDGMINHQLMGPCAPFELRAMECLEAYGMDRAAKKCRDILDDFRECAYRDKQMARVELMQAERAKKIKEGKLDPHSTKYDPVIGSY